jgi:hypothetical protein
MWACRPLVDAEACPLSEGDQQARCTNGAAGGWFEQAGLPAAPNTRSERPRSRSAQPRPASPFQNELLRDWFLCRHSDERQQKKPRRSGAKFQWCR